VYLAPNPSLVQHGAQAVRLGKLETLDELYDKLFHGIEEITGEPKVEFELIGATLACFGLVLIELKSDP
jgi:hypothetical protein